MKRSVNILSALVGLTLVLGVVGCGVTRPVTTTTQVVSHYRDSVRWKDSTILVPVPVERYVDVVPVYDTLRLETTVASASAYVDTLTHTLKGRLINKPDSIRTIVKFKDRLVEVTRDSLVTKEVPVEVEVPVRYVPRFYKYCLAWSILSLVLIFIFVYLKLKA